MKQDIIGPRRRTDAVVPRAGTWIETLSGNILLLDGQSSFPVRERGLKLYNHCDRDNCHIVVPRAGTWIETNSGITTSRRARVVPRAGTWIETYGLMEK